MLNRSHQIKSENPKPSHKQQAGLLSQFKGDNWNKVKRIAESKKQDLTKNKYREGQAVSHPQRQPKGPLVGLRVLRDPRQKGWKKSDTGRRRGGIRTRRGERSGVVLLGTAPRGGELGRDRGRRVGPREKPSAVVRTPRGGAPAVGRRAAPGQEIGGAVPNAVGCWRVASATESGGAEDRWTRSWAPRLDWTPGAGPGRRRGTGEDSAGPGRAEPVTGAADKGGSQAPPPLRPTTGGW
ncbi:hypothetical protein NDU88_004226 [Pleurodeles waltl]|uniref:Uncharacterized protein n=1 Tax=Pleurodeles waltl TaxID=8319 RepID=A0AAV7LKT0_PLEWA|nr:hypothetical protein NDU88_004226 [Pleurodeles waltl]